MATEEAEKALEAINSGLNSQKPSNNISGSTEEDDFDLPSLLAEHKSSKGRTERSEIIKDTDTGSELDDDDEEEEYSKEMAGFINDSESEDGSFSSSENDMRSISESELDTNATTRKSSRGISFSFGSSDESSELENEVETAAQEQNSIANIVEDDAPQKKRSARLIMSDDDEE